MRLILRPSIDHADTAALEMGPERNQQMIEFASAVAGGPDQGADRDK